MAKHKIALIIAGAALAVALAAFGIGEIKTTPKPVLECAEEGQPTSGFSTTLDDGTECKVKAGYVKEQHAYEWPPHKRPARIVTAIAALVFIISGITSLVMWTLAKKKAKGIDSTKSTEVTPKGDE